MRVRLPDLVVRSSERALPGTARGAIGWLLLWLLMALQDALSVLCDWIVLAAGGRVHRPDDEPGAG